jgi:hypothetical protein
MVLQKFEGTAIEIIPITPEPGIHAIAFALKEILDEWAPKTEEIAMDSTFKSSKSVYQSMVTNLFPGKTNEAGYEVYGFVAEAPWPSYANCIHLHDVIGRCC